MTVPEALTKFQALGKPGMRDHHLKHGAPDDCYGVVLSDLRKIAKFIKRDHALALDLWKTDNVEAKLLATLIFDVQLLAPSDLDALARSCDFFKTADWFEAHVARVSKHTATLVDSWRADADTLVSRIGWSLTASGVRKHTETRIEELLQAIESTMVEQPFRKQEPMNYCLVQIGYQYPEIRQRCLDIAEKLGVFRDYPTAKGCLSPFAPTWIAYLLQHGD